MNGIPTTPTPTTTCLHALYHCWVAARPGQRPTRAVRARPHATRTCACMRMRAAAAHIDKEAVALERARDLQPAHGGRVEVGEHVEVLALTVHEVRLRACMHGQGHGQGGGHAHTGRHRHRVRQAGRRRGLERGLHTRAITQHPVSMAPRQQQQQSPASPPAGLMASPGLAFGHLRCNLRCLFLEAAIAAQWLLMHKCRPVRAANPPPPPIRTHTPAPVPPHAHTRAP